MVAEYDHRMNRMNAKNFEKKGRQDCKKVAQALYKAYDYAIIDGTVYVHLPEEGIYTRLTVKRTARLYVALFGEGVCPTEQESHRIFKALLALAKESADEVSPAEGIIAFQDGDYDLRTGVLLPSSPRRAVLKRLPHRCPPKDTQPTEFVENWMNIWSNGEPQFRKRIEQAMGLALMGRPEYVFSLIPFVGGGSEGKKAFARMLEAILGEKI